MRRFMLGFAATVTLLVMTLSFKTSATGHGRALNPASAHATATPQHTSGAAAPTGTRTATGPTASTPFGPVQVRITVSGTHITGIDAVQTPSDASYSRQVAAYAVPILRQEALAAQSAHIDAVSGATWTSQGYADSLQVALDRVGI